MKTFNIKDTNIIKGIAIMIMIFHHLFWSTSFSLGYNISFAPLNTYRVSQIAMFFKICVPIFTFLSGFGLLYCYKKQAKNFYIARVLKLLPTFIVIVVICSIYTQVIDKTIIRTFFSHGIFKGIFCYLFEILGISNLIGTPSINPNWWYIGAMYIFIYLVPIFYKSIKKIGPLYTGLAIILIPRLLKISIDTSTALPYVFSLYLGMICQEYKILEKLKNKSLVNKQILNKIIKFIIYIILILILFIYNSNINAKYIWEINFGLTPFVFILFCYEFINPIKYLNNILELIGKNSYIMFLIHFILTVYYKDPLYNLNSFILTYLSTLLISFIVSYLIGFTLEKIGFNKFFKNKINSITSKEYKI